MTPTKRTSTAEVSVEVALDAHAALGEGPVWDDANGTLIWVDILGQAVHRWDPKIGRDHVVDVGQPVGAAALRSDGKGLVLALRDGFALFDEAAGRVELLAPVEADVPTNRMNDGKCDAAGRFWAGTMASHTSRVWCSRNSSSSARSTVSPRPARRVGAANR